MKTHKLGSGVGFGHRTLAVERLEGRAMLAGNVTAFVDGGGNLIVRGDNNDNAVLVQQTPTGQYSVTGFDFADSGVSGFRSGPTSINGSANGTVMLSGVRGDINIDLKKGSDALGVGNSLDDLLSLAEGCGFGLGLGSGTGSGSSSGSSSDSNPELKSEALQVQPVEGRFFAPRNLIINTGDGNDAVVVSADVENSAIINTGNGNDGVAVGNVATSESDVNIGNDLVILTGRGNDNACASFVTLDGLLTMQTGDGADEVSATDFDAGHAVIITGNNNDSVTMARFDTDREIVVDSGNGSDGVALSSFSAGQGFGPNEQRGAGYVTVVTGNGNDSIAIEGAATDSEQQLTTSTVDNLTVNAGSGNDQVTLSDLEVRNNLFAFLGAGNDFLAVKNDQIRNALLIDAGAGQDKVTLSNSQIGGDATILMGAGNDQLTIVGSNGDRRLTVIGGSGKDTFFNDLGIDSNGSQGNVTTLQFEFFGPPTD